jgi:hypothetical protein
VVAPPDSIQTTYSFRVKIALTTVVDLKARAMPKPPQETPKDKGKQHEEEKLDEALEESFPASDPPAPVQPHKPKSGQRKS